MNENEVFAAVYIIGLMAGFLIAALIIEAGFRFVYRRSRRFRRWFNGLYKSLPMSDKRW